MRINLKQGDSLTAVLGSAATTTNPVAHVEWEEAGSNRKYTTPVNLTDDTAVDLLAAPSGRTPEGYIVTGFTVYNGDTAAADVTVAHVVSCTSYTLFTVSLAVGDTLQVDESGFRAINSSGRSQTVAEIGLGDDVDLLFGTGNDAAMLWSTGDASNHSTVVGLGDSNQSLHITDKAARATDWNISADTHPTVYVHSNTTPSTDYLKIGAHTGTVAEVDVVGGTTLYVKAAGNEIADFVQTASAVNGLKFLSNSTGAAPAIGSNGNGAESDIGLEILDSNGNELIEFVATASAVNGIRVVNAATGNMPIITNEGEVDTGIILANYDGTNTEQILILDGIASAVNELTVKNAATGNSPSVSATGDDSDINITVTPKGAGYAIISSGGLQVRADNAVTATTDGTGTGLIPAGASFCTVTSDDANKQIALPVASVGDEIWIQVGATGCELISSVAAHKVNNVVVGATNELALVATSSYRCKYVATNTWIVRGFTNQGADEAALTPDAL